MALNGSSKVHIRTPTYKRPEALRRCLDSLRAQTHQDWICTVFDDDPDQSAQAVCSGFGDDRIHYVPNPGQLFASANIDQCFSRNNPHDARYFCVVEDDNYILPTFIESNIAICKRQGVELILRNQLIEHASGTPVARLSEFGVLDALFVDGLYDPEEFRLSLLAGIGVSNGGLFWSRRVISELEIGFRCTATLQEYMRTFSIREKIYVAMEPLAVWAENGEQTTRNLNLSSSYLRRELDLKHAIQVLQKEIWRTTSKTKRELFLASPRYACPPEARAAGLIKALITSRVGNAVSIGTKANLLARGLLIRTAGRVDTEFNRFVAARLALPDLS